MAKSTTKESESYAGVRRKRFRIDELEPAPYNARSITDQALRGLSESLRRFGVMALPVVNVATNPPRIVGGHQRITALRAAGQEEVECVVVSLDPVAEKQANFALNNPHIEGAFIPALTRDLIAQIAEQHVDPKSIPSLRLDVLLKQVLRNAEQDVVDRVVREGQTDDDAEASPSLRKVGVASKVGRVYALGDHRIACANVASESSLERFGVQFADMAIATLTDLTEPTDANTLGALLRHTVQRTDGPIYLATTIDVWPAVQAAFIACGGHWSNTVIAYGTHNPSASVPFNYASLALIHGWRQGQPCAFHGADDRGNVWKLRTPITRDRLPVEAFVKAVLHGSVAGGTVLDVCADYGSSLIACEKTGRRLLGYVGSAREMDRVRQRWAEFVHGENADWKTLTAEV